MSCLLGTGLSESRAAQVICCSGVEPPSAVLLKDQSNFGNIGRIADKSALPNIQPLVPL
jgi:hypothetical protein